MTRGEPVKSISPDEPDAADLASAPAERARRLLQEGQLVDARALLSSHPQLQADKSLVLDLAYEEYCQRCEAGAPVDADEFCGRFPYRSSLRRLLGVHHFLEENPHLLGDGQQASWPVAGQQFLGFTLLRELGRGSFARVFLATEPALGGRAVAVKVSRLGATEAQTLGRLNHPNIVPVHSVQVDRDTGFTVICMPYLGSATLCDLLDRILRAPGIPETAAVVLETLQSTVAAPSTALQLPAARVGQGPYVDAVIRIGSQLADALAAAHAQGICHRDLKPSNVLLATDARPMLLDFNLSADRQVAVNLVGGTLPYMAPEQLRATDPKAAADGSLVDARSDIFSLGVILYELLAGVHPFAPLPGSGPRDEIRHHLLERQQHGPRSLQEINPRVDRPLARLIECCLAFAPQDRPPHGRQLAVDLRRAVYWKRRAARWLGQRRRLATTAVLLVVLLASLTAYAWWSRDPYGVRQQHLGAAAYQRGSYRDAVEHFNRALADEPASAEILFARGRAWQQLGDLTLARADFEVAGRLVEDGRLRACQAYCRCALGEYEEAVALFERAIAKGVATAELFNDLGYCYLLLGKLDDARKALDRAVALNPGLQAPFHNRAMVALQRMVADPEGGSGTGLADIGRALEIGPPAADLYHHAAGLHAVAGQNDLALSCLRRAVELGEDPQTLRDDYLFRNLRTDAWFQQITRAPRARNTPVRSVRILDPIKDTSR